MVRNKTLYELALLYQGVLVTQSITVVKTVKELQDESSSSSSDEDSYAKSDMDGSRCIPVFFSTEDRIHYLEKAISHIESGIDLDRPH